MCVESVLKYLSEQKSERDLSYGKIDVWHDVDRAASFTCRNNFACDALEDWQRFRKQLDLAE